MYVTVSVCECVSMWKGEREKMLCRVGESKQERGNTIIVRERVFYQLG